MVSKDTTGSASGLAGVVPPETTIHPDNRSTRSPSLPPHPTVPSLVIVYPRHSLTIALAPTRSSCSWSHALRHTSRQASSRCTQACSTGSHPLQLNTTTLGQPATMGFGDFSTICTKAAIPLCALVGHQEINGGAGIQPNCYSRTIEIANTLIFQAANDFMHILALIMTVVMIIHVRSKFTAVGMLHILRLF
jgi:hypothetical protein